ncbi:MAG: helix-turn-helix domain-containing protein, partial [Rhizobiaceae bacterium]|nr:helix-turn-helix domain-containing protein [Rhizobiaceae bacterium]
EGLAQSADVSRAMLSRIERGESSPTAQLLAKICRGLGTTLSVLFSATEAPASPLARRCDQPVWRDPGSGYLRRNVSPPGTGSPVDIVEVEFPPGQSVALDNLRLSGVDQHVWVLDGQLEMTVGDEVFSLGTGDCIMMLLDRPTGFRNRTDRMVRYAVIISRGVHTP